MAVVSEPTTRPLREEPEDVTCPGHSEDFPDRSPAQGHNDSAAHGTLFASILSVANIILRSGVTFALMPVLISTLGEEHYALWITISSVTMFLCLSEAGLGQTVINKVGSAFAKENLEGVRQVQTTAYILYWILVIPTCILALLSLAFLPIGEWLLAESDLHNSQLLLVCLVITSILALSRIPFLVFSATLTGLRNFPQRLVCEMAATILVTVGTISAAYAGTGLIGVVITSNILFTATGVVVYFVLLRYHPWAKLRLSDFRSEQLWPLAANSGFFF